MPVISSYTYAQAVALPLPQWFLTITNWGNNGTGQDANSLQYQTAIPGGVEYLGIGPSSTVNQTEIRWTLTGVGTTYGPTLQITKVGVGVPGISLTGPLLVLADTDTFFADTYQQDGNATPQPFGGTLPLIVFEKPTLQLVFYPRTPTVYPATQRALMNRTGTIDIAAGTTEQLIAVWPVAGRGAKAVYFTALGTLVGTARVGLISNHFAGTLIEDTIATGAVNATTGINFSAASSQPCQFIAVYFTRSAGAGSVLVQMTAQDAAV